MAQMNDLKTAGLSIGSTPRYVNSQPSVFMKTLAEEDIHNRLKRMEADNEYAKLEESEDDN